MQLLPDNTYLADPALRSALSAALRPEVAAWAEPQLLEMGHSAAHRLKAWGDECESHPAFLRPIEPWGARVDEIVYPEAWKRLAEVAARAGLAGMPYDAEAARVAGPQARLVQTALCYLFEPGTATYHCPVAMTDAAASVLAQFGPERLRSDVLPHLASRDPATAWTAGQWMTEQQGGSDVGANAVEAVGEGDGWRLHGRKYFCSNVGGEVVLALARPRGAAAGTRGLGLFLVPRLLGDGSPNRYRIDRLKDKLGTRAMATGEVTLEGAYAELVGDLERGFAQMTPMLNITRLHNAIAAAAGMRRGVMVAREYARQRTAFGRTLDAHPLQRQVLLEMAVKAEGMLLLTLRIAELLGQLECGVTTEQEQRLLRVGTSIAKLYTAKHAVAMASEAVEAFGGAGYMEDTGIARMLRDAQVLPIWEGTTNVLSLDALRVLAKPGVAPAFIAELERLDAAGRPAIEAMLARLAAMEPASAQRWGRRLTFAMGEAWTEGLLRQAAGRGAREAAVHELWTRRGDPLDTPGDGFELVLDGTRELAPATVPR